MNIAAAQAILKANISAASVSDTSKRHASTIATKAAALVVACHAGRANLTARLSIQEIATEMGATYNTARQALDRAITEGLLAVENPGEIPTAIRSWRVTTPPQSREGTPPQSREALPPNRANPPPQSRNLKKRRDREEKERSAADNVRKRSSSERRGDVDKAPPDVAPGPPRLNGEPTRLAAALASLPAAREALARLPDARPKGTP